MTTNSNNSSSSSSSSSNTSIHSIHSIHSNRDNTSITTPPITTPTTTLAEPAPTTIPELAAPEPNITKPKRKRKRISEGILKQRKAKADAKAKKQAKE
jgi:hypothetical protein